MSTLGTLAGSPEPKKATLPARVPLHERHDGDRVEVIPYDGRGDVNADKFLPWFYTRLKDAGLLSIYYPGKVEYSFTNFVRLLSGDVQTMLFVIKNKEDAVEDCIGVATWTPMNLNGSIVGNAGFIFLPEYWDRQTTIEACKRGMRFWFEEMQPQMNIVLGINPKGNVLVQRFLHRLGWAKVGEVPIPQFYNGEMSDMAIWYCTKEMFEKVKEKL